MKVHSVCKNSKKGKPYHTSVTPGPGEYTAPPDECWICVDKKERAERTQEWRKG